MTLADVVNLGWLVLIFLTIIFQVQLILMVGDVRKMTKNFKSRYDLMHWWKTRSK
jgi:hypothetical protein